MGSREVDDFPSLEQNQALTDAQIIRKFAPHYIAMGMSATEYWEGDPRLCIDYRKAHRIKRQQAEEDAWMHGFYVYNALCKTSPLFRDWLKDHKPEPYYEKPIGFFEPLEDVKKQEEQKKELTVRNKLDDWMAKVNRSMKKKEKANERRCN